MSQPLLDLYVLDPDVQSVNAIRAGVGPAGLRLAATYSNADQALSTLMSTCAQVVVIDLASCTDIAVTIRKLLVACPATCIIVTGSGTPPATMSRAVAAGARGFLIKPYQTADLFATIKEAVEVSHALSQRQAVPQQQTPDRARGRIVAVYSPKGGVGSTTVATNLAVALASRPKTSVALIDLDLQFGDVGAALDLHGANSIAEVIGEEELTPDLVQETFVKHSSGVRALLAPEDLSLVEGIDPDLAVRLLTNLRPHFDYIVADLWSSLESLTTGVLRVADRVLLVTTPELPSLRNLQRVLQATHDDLHLDEKSIVVANRYPGKTGLSLPDMAKALSLPISVKIPSEGVTVTDAINRGLSLLDSRARVRLAKHYHELAALVAQGTSVSPIGVSRTALKEVSR